jgi:hypothetical protein
MNIFDQLICQPKENDFLQFLPLKTVAILWAWRLNVNDRLTMVEASEGVAALEGLIRGFPGESRQTVDES